MSGSQYNSNDFVEGIKGKYYYYQTEELIKSFCFFGLFIAGFMEYYNGGKTIKDIFQDPFFIGAGIMSIAALLTFVRFKYTRVDYTFPAMFFFIFTKLVSQYFHYYHLNLDGTEKHISHS